MTLLEDKVVGVSEDAEKGVLDLLEKMNAENAEIITVYAGEDITAEKLEELSAAIQDKYPDCEVSPLSGGQPVYYYTISVE